MLLVIIMRLIENEYCELKSILTKDIKKEIIAFANTKGGKIYIGIDDKNTILGMNNIDNTLQSLTGMINEGIKPSLIEYTQSGPNKPYYLADKGLKPSGVYLRHGASSIPASDEMIRKMIFEHASLRFEEMISRKQDLTFDYLEKNLKITI